MGYLKTAIVQPSHTPTIFYVEAFLLLIFPIFFEWVPEFISIGSFIFGLVISLYHFVRRKAFNLFASKIGLVWLALGLLATTSYFFSHGNLDTLIILFFAGILLVYIGSSSTEWIKPFVVVLLVMLFVHAVATVILYAFPQLYAAFIKPHFPTNDYATNYTAGITSHYSYNATYIVEGFLISSSLLLFKKEKDGKKRLLVVVSLIFLFALFLTTKRAHLVYGVFAVICVYYFSSRKNKIIKSIFAVTLFCAAVTVLASYSDGINESLTRLFGTFEARDLEEATLGRTFLWQAAYENWISNPILGIGWRSFRYFWANGVDYSVLAHNELLQFLCETGIVGTVCIVSCMIVTLVATIRQFKPAIGLNDTSKYCAWAPAIALSLQLFFIFYGFTSGNILHDVTCFYCYFFSIAIPVSLGASNDTRLKSGEY